VLGWAFLAIGALQLAGGVAGYLLRDRVQQERSVQAQVKDRAEPGGPGPGG
jgi:hypothetical protein